VALVLTRVFSVCADVMNAGAINAAGAASPGHGIYRFGQMII